MKVLVLLAAIYGVLFYGSHCELSDNDFYGPYSKTWAYQCPFVKEYEYLNLQQCECACTESDHCNVISYKENQCCDLRKCNKPIPVAQSQSPKGFVGYKLKNKVDPTKRCCGDTVDCVALNDPCIRPCQCKCNRCCEDPVTLSTVCRPIDTSVKDCITPSAISGGQSQCGKGELNGVNATTMPITESQTQEGEFPWTVAVLSKDNTTYVAGGSLVHRRVILTAAHKVHGKDAVDLVARIGYWDLKKEDAGSQNIDLEKIVLHPNFDRRLLKYNVALLILKKAVLYNNFTMPISLPTSNQLFDGSTCFISGWGKDVFEEQRENQMIMKKTPISIMSHDQCQAALRNSRLGRHFILHDSFVCAGGQGEDACATDGGSPLVCPDPSQHDRYVQVGVSSWGIGCNTVGNPAVFGSIPKTVDWINEIINNETGSIVERIE